MRVHLTPTAEAELTEIRKYYATAESPDLARRFRAEVRETIALLGRHPKMGRRIGPLRRVLLRRFPFSLVYDIREDAVYITYLQHHRQNRPDPDDLDPEE